MPRAIWSGSISFGLVSVPVKLYSAVSQKDVRFHQLEEKSGARIRYKRVSAKTGREVPYERIVKGYESGKNRYVVVTPDELEALDPKSTRMIEIQDFVELDEIDPIYYDHPYWLVPDKGGEKAYRLLLKAMEETGMVGVARVVLRTKQYLAAIRTYGKVLMLETMLFHDEVVSPEKLDMPEETPRVSERELTMARQLVQSLAREFEPERYKDEYRERVMELIHKKEKDEDYTIEEAAEEPAAVVDLMEALRASVEAAGSDGRSRRKASSSSKRGSKSRRKSA